MQKLTKEQKILVLDLLICSFENERLKRYGAIGFYMTEFPGISESDILKQLNSYISNSTKFENELRKRIQALASPERHQIKSNTDGLMRVIGKFIDLPGERSQVNFRLGKFI